MSSPPGSEVAPGRQSASELQLGIRELFRVFVPGAYALLLAAVLPGAVIPESISASNPRLAAAALCLGLVAYALRPHESCWPYSDAFWIGVDKLDTEIKKAARGDSSDHTAPYKYFLTIGLPHVSARIHYFSSFYYMLVAISMYSAAGALGESVVPALRVAWTSNLRGIATFAAAAMALGCLLQVWLLVRPTSRTAVAPINTAALAWRSSVRYWLLKRLHYVPCLLVAVALVVVFSSISFATGMRFFSAERTMWIAAMLLASLIFANLAAKQWRAIIEEQIVHVRQSKEALSVLISSGKSS